jgi:hypothetical protein
MRNLCYYKCQRTEEPKKMDFGLENAIDSSSVL